MAADAAAPRPRTVSRERAAFNCVACAFAAALVEFLLFVGFFALLSAGAGVAS